MPLILCHFSLKIFANFWDLGGQVSAQQEISAHQVELMPVREREFIILNASPMYTSGASTIKVVSKSVHIQCTEVHTQLCYLYDLFYIKGALAGLAARTLLLILIRGSTSRQIVEQRETK